MELDTIKSIWQEKEIVSYSREELASIYYIKKANTLTRLKDGFSLDLILALVLSVVFIVVLQILNFESSNFWSVCMGILAFQHILFYNIQRKMIKKNLEFEQNVLQSIDKTISRLRSLLWFYRVWPALLSVFLYNFYIYMFTPEWSTFNMLVAGAIITVGIGILANYISAVMIRRHILRLSDIKKEYEEAGE
jgi:hypothetical protein